MRKRILTINQKGKRILVDSAYCRVGSVYEKPIIKTKKDDKQNQISTAGRDLEL